MRYKLGLCMGNGAPPALVTCIMPKTEKVTGKIKKKPPKTGSIPLPAQGQA